MSYMITTCPDCGVTYDFGVVGTTMIGGHECKAAQPDIPGGIDYDRWTPLVKPAPREAFADSLDLIDFDVD